MTTRYTLICEEPEIPIDNPFVMDAKFDAGSTSKKNGTLQELTFGWSLSRSTGALAGPSSVSYDLTVAASNAEVVTMNGAGCAPISSTLASFPYSDTAHAADRTADFPTCTLTSLGSGKFRLTLSNINYSGDFPTVDSKGDPLPIGMDVVASGQVSVKFTYSSAGTFTLAATAPTYVAAGNPSVTSVDDPSNNKNAQAYTRGVWSHGFASHGALSQGSIWTDTYRTFAGATVWAGSSVAAEVGNGTCIVMDTRYVTFKSAKVASAVSVAAYSGVTIWYFSGQSEPLLTPSNANYDPNAWTGCGTKTPALDGWTTTPPANLSTVRAVRAVHTANTIAQGVAANGTLGMYVEQTIKADTPVGQDIWTWGAYNNNGPSGAWTTDPNRSLQAAQKPAAGTATPGARYPFTGAGRDVLRIIGSVPVVEKEVLQKEAGPGTEVDYAIRYGLSADATAGFPVQVVLVDTLPAGMAYVAGSSVPAPVVTGTVAAGQKLTWTINNVGVNKTPLDVVNFKATVPENATPGATFTNRVTSTSQGQNATATAQFVVPKSGYTTLSKTAAAADVESVDGVAKNSWTVTMESFDPAPNAVTDVMDILPDNGDERGTDFADSYQLDGAPTVAAGSTIYYSTASQASLNEDPQHVSNGAFGTTADNTVGWSTTYNAEATAIRVIGPSLAYGKTQAFTVKIVTAASEGGNTFVNTAVGRATSTQLRMRTSAAFEVRADEALTIKKYVRDLDGNWHDAQTAADYPSFQLDQTPRYRIVVTNTGNRLLKQVPVDDDKADLGQLFVDGKLSSSSALQADISGVRISQLAVGETATIEYDLPLAAIASEGSTLINNACVSLPAGSPEPKQLCDPAGITLLSSLSWNKIGAYSATTFLQGSEWKLVRAASDGGAPLAGAVEVNIIDCVADDCTGVDRDPRTGRFRAVGMETGWYRLTETLAPAGYVLADAPFYVYVDGTSTVGGSGIVNQIADVPSIPLTGGTGELSFWSIAALAGLLVASGLLWQRRRTA